MDAEIIKRAASDAEAVSGLASMEGTADAIVVESQAGYDTAANFLMQVAGARKRVEAERKKFTDPPPGDRA